VRPVRVMLWNDDRLRVGRWAIFLGRMCSVPWYVLLTHSFPHCPKYRADHSSALPSETSTATYPFYRRTTLPGHRAVWPLFDLFIVPYSRVRSTPRLPEQTRDPHVVVRVWCLACNHALAHITERGQEKSSGSVKWAGAFSGSHADPEYAAGRSHRRAWLLSPPMLVL
jgi:hypothetical protein